MIIVYFLIIGDTDPKSLDEALQQIKRLKFENDALNKKLGLKEKFLETLTEKMPAIERHQNQRKKKSFSELCKFWN